jgi:hypothetical protein
MVNSSSANVARELRVGVPRPPQGFVPQHFFFGIGERTDPAIQVLLVRDRQRSRSTTADPIQIAEDKLESRDMHPLDERDLPIQGERSRELTDRIRWLMKLLNLRHD